MSLMSRIEKLEEKLALKNRKIFFIGWADCIWQEAEGIRRNQAESIEEFQIRVLNSVKKRFIWVK